jgi:plasmid stabilization system protein ParE
MRKYRVEITEIAESDIQNIFTYISKDKSSAAMKWIEEVERQIYSLERFPLRCAIIPEAEELGREYRHIIYGNYRTIFRMDKSKVIIMRVIHGARLLDLGIFEK